MSKPKRERSLPDNEAKAIARMLRVSPQKLNLVAQLIRGRKASAALADLQFSRKRIAVDVKKCLESAIANAGNNHDLEVDDLIVAEAHVGNGIVMKRFAPRGRGRSGRIFKPFSQLTIVVRQVEASASNGRGGERWVRRSIQSGCVSASTGRGIRVGTQARTNTASCCTRTSKSARCCTRN